ncbi:MAG: DUF411 domain-containing protein [Chromatiales bacterium]|nr:DUF411 domain-containing protein [Chromatiales bacterium]
MNRLRRLLLAAMLLSPAASALAEELPLMKIWKTPTCGCCGVWVDRMVEAGFPVEVTDLNDLTPIKLRYNITPRLSSCHTAEVAGYVVEGHIPAEDIIRMIREQPDIRGIAVPGMPIGSPGMEVEGMAPERYNVIALERSGPNSIWARHNDN